jgi:hypothetical protein
MKFTSLIICLATLSTGTIATEQKNSTATNIQQEVIAVTKRVVQTNRHLSEADRKIPAVLSEARVVQTNRHLSKADRKIPAILAAKKEPKTNRHFR